MNNKLDNFLMFCWIDNSVVNKFVSNLHLGTSNEKVLNGRR